MLLDLLAQNKVEMTNTVTEIWQDILVLNNKKVIHYQELFP